MKSNLTSKLPGVEEQGKRTLPRADHSEPKMHGVCNCGVLAASQCCFGTFKGVRRALTRVHADESVR